MMEKQMKFYSKPLHNMRERQFCGNEFQVNEKVTLFGWIENIRKINDEFHFIVLRDTSGKIQLQFNPKEYPSFKDIPVESVIEIQGRIQERPDSMKNKKMKNGDLEVMVSEMEILNVSPSSLPLQLKNSEEEVRLRYRYLDLRREELQYNLKQRSKMIQEMRNFLLENKFLEVETPSKFKVILM
jgi:aspartyl-tRNA synthetase